MNKEDALRDLYDHERDLRLALFTGFAMLFTGYIMAAIGFGTDSLFALIGSLIVIGASGGIFSIATGTTEDGYNRRFWGRVSSGMDGVPLETKREALAEYRITEESDLEDIE